MNYKCLMIKHTELGLASYECIFDLSAAESQLDSNVQSGSDHLRSISWIKISKQDMLEPI